MDKEVKEVNEAKDSEPKRYCKKCNVEIAIKRRKVFCSVKCAKAFHSLKRYHKIKSSQDYKDKRKVYVQNKRKKEVIVQQ